MKQPTVEDVTEKEIADRFAGRFPPHGRVFRCTECAALLRTGWTMHTARYPTPHQFFELAVDVVLADGD